MSEKKVFEVELQWTTTHYGSRFVFATSEEAAKEVMQEEIDSGNAIEVDATRDQWDEDDVTISGVYVNKVLTAEEADYTEEDMEGEE